MKFAIQCDTHSMSSTLCKYSPDAFILLVRTYLPLLLSSSFTFHWVISIPSQAHFQVLLKKDWSTLHLVSTWCLPASTIRTSLLFHHPLCFLCLWRFLNILSRFVFLCNLLKIKLPPTISVTTVFYFLLFKYNYQHELSHAWHLYLYNICLSGLDF